jgi:putative membrane protein
MVNLTDGTGELRDNTTGLDTKLTDKINEVLDPLRGGTGSTHSFVSEKNTQVSSVQFVMHTPAIEKTESEVPDDETEEDLNLMQRVLRLFGLA